MTSTSVTRRRFLASSLATATALRFAPRAFALPGDACLLTAEQEVGPFYVADESLRSAIAEGKPGVPLHVRLVVVDQTSCLPIPHAAVDLWHCDAMGLYSGFTASSGFGPPGGGPGGGPGGPPPGFDPRHGPPGGGGPEGGGPEDGGPHGPPPASKPTDKFTFLRGVQMTDNEGAVSFQTIFPGFYQGRRRPYPLQGAAWWASQRQNLRRRPCLTHRAALLSRRPEPQADGRDAVPRALDRTDDHGRGSCLQR